MLSNIIEELTLEKYPIQKSLLRDALIRVDYNDFVDFTPEIISAIEKYLLKTSYRLKETGLFKELRFQLNLNIDPRNFDPMDTVETLPVEHYNHRKILVIKEEETNTIIHVSPLFSFIQQKGSFINNEPPYKKFPDLSNILINILEIINNHIPLSYNRIGIRKINSQFSQKKKELKEAFNNLLIKDLDFFRGKPKKTDNPKIEKLYNFKLNNHNINLLTVLQVFSLMNPDQEEVNAYNFNYDIDTYLTKVDVEIKQSDLFSILEKANKYSFAMFLWCLKEEARQKLVNNEYITEISL